MSSLIRKVRISLTIEIDRRKTEVYNYIKSRIPSEKSGISSEKFTI